MPNKRTVAARIYLIAMVIMIITLIFTGVFAEDQQQDKEVQTLEEKETINWRSNTRNKDVKISDKVGNGEADWGSETFTESEGNHNNRKNNASSNKATTLALLAGIAGILGVAALTGKALSKKDVTSIIPEGNGIWVPEADRVNVEVMINKVASKKYYIDEHGFVREVVGYEQDTNKSETYSNVLDALIAGEKKVIIGMQDGWMYYDAKSDKISDVSFNKNNGGVTIGDNGTDQVIIISDQEAKKTDVQGNIVYGGAEITLAHELAHALRGTYNLKNANLNGGTNHDEEAYAIQLENKIRNELGYGLRGNGDSSDDVNQDGIPDGDGSYGRYNIAAQAEGWYNNLEMGSNSESLSIYNCNCSSCPCGCSSCSCTGCTCGCVSCSCSSCSCGCSCSCSSFFSFFRIYQYDTPSWRYDNNIRRGNRYKCNLSQCI